VLIATNVLARGVNIDIEYVVSFYMRLLNLSLF
jgi:hypothetical protein